MKESALFLLLTVLLSFTAPVVVLTLGVVTISTVSLMPGLGAVGQQGYVHFLGFLETFGDGCPFMGILTIGSAGACAGGLFGAGLLLRPLHSGSARLGEPLLANKARQN